MRYAKRNKKKNNVRCILISVAVIGALAALCAFFQKIGHGNGTDLKSSKAISVPMEEYAFRIGPEYYSAADIAFFERQVYDEYSAYCKTYFGDESYVTAFLDKETLLDEAVRKLRNTYALYNDAIKNGFSEIDDSASRIEAARAEASAIGITYDSYLTRKYGTDMTLECFEKNSSVSEIASVYSSFMKQKPVYSEADLEDYYQKHRNKFTYVDYEQLFYYASGQYSDEDAYRDAEAAFSAAQKGGSLQTISNETGKGSYSFSRKVPYNESEIFNWLFDVGREENDTVLIHAEGVACYVIRFIRAYREEYPTINFRHILFPFESRVIENSYKLGEDEIETEKNETRKIAELYADVWRNGERTEESFSSLYKDLYGTPDGDLYKRVYNGQMITVIDDWLYDPAREIGDFGLVESELGVHLLLFTGTDVPYWQVQTETALRNEEYVKFENSLITDDTERLAGFSFAPSYLS